jgi:CubicO group peptidase (beta-lactamase class C family)
MKHPGLLLIGAALVASPSVVCAQPANIAARADQYLSVRADMGNFTGAVLIAKGDRILFRKGYGYADVAKRIPFTPETQHEVASVSKMFTAMAALKLRDAGKLELTDSICRYLDECPATWQPITIDEVIHHSSGIPDYEDPLGLGSDAYMKFMMAPDAIVRIVTDARSKPLDFPPGTKFSYSNTAYDVLSYIVQRAAGKSFPAYVKSTLLGPAGMTHSGVIGVDTPENLETAYTSGDLGWDKILGGVSFADGFMQPVANLPLTPPDGDAWLFTTLDDLFKWSRVMDGSKLVSPAEAAEVLAPELDTYGFGWFIDKTFDRVRYSHTGALPGRLTNFIKFPADSITIIIFSNSDRGRMASVTHDLSAIALGQPYDMPVRGTVVKLSPGQIAPLLGEYRQADGKVLTISAGDMLTAKLTGRYTAGLIPLSPTEFYFPLADGRAIFTLGPDGRATKVNMRYSGTDHIATR